MWYTEHKTKTELDYSKPIVYKNRLNVYLLLPVPGLNYGVKGYDWFDLTSGEWSSCRLWSTPQEVVQAYSGYSLHNVSNILPVEGN